MVLLLLSIKAELENIAFLEPSDGFDYFFRVKCTSCNEQHPKLVSLNRAEEFEVSGSKGNTAHFVWRCSLCKRGSSAKFDPSKTLSYTEEHSGQLAPFLKIECRGLEFTSFEPRGSWTCHGTTGTVFKDVDLVENDMWTDYDEKVGLPVSVSEFDSEWRRA
ncbi:hypothetical protein E1B28_001027 [Marasmius oreades]|uniref:DUF866-domain-containing protein n=1 Tax=Marasmius oreades TaxID=181124 RepID=A0A9P7V2J3_9AGAR|nr:uncharacterized protein E1B28_001027 [Marasmius oreades]KAG7099156.1 hypothetical protein E1B28_001027 [Marasmius oreades]